MRLGIMQPYFFPYIGYWQLLNAVDEYVIYDNIQYTKKGWINRNRYLKDGKPEYFTVPLMKDSDFLDVRERTIASSFDRQKLLNRITFAYRKAPCFEQAFSLFEKCVIFDEDNLFEYIYHSVREICDYLGIKTKITVSSSLDAEALLRGQDRVLALCRKAGASEYINAIGGVELYDTKAFSAQGIRLLFLKTGEIRYRQFGNEFCENLSILDVMMFRTAEEIKELLGKYQLLEI